MGNKTGNVDSLPRMIIREPTEANTTMPELPVMPPEYAYGGEWMDPQWKKDVRTTKKLFTVYPVQMIAIIVVTIGLAIGLASLSSTISSGGKAESEAAAESSGCAGSGSSETDDEQDQEYNDEEQADPNALLGSPVTGTIGDIDVTICGYKFADDLYDVSSIMVEYEIVNNGDASTYFYYLDHKAFQNDVQLTNSYGKTEEYDNEELIREILPGGTLTVHCLYNIVNTTDPVQIVVGDILQLTDETVTATFELTADDTPAAMPDDTTAEMPDDTTAAATSTTTAAQASSQSSEGSIGDYYIKYISSSSFVDDWDDTCVRVTFEFTNNSDDATSAWSALGYYAYQGSTELSEDTYFYDDDYASLSAEVQSGSTAKVTLVFSGVEPDNGDVKVTIYNYWDQEQSITFSCSVN